VFETRSNMNNNSDLLASSIGDIVKILNGSLLHCQLKSAAQVKTLHDAFDQ